MTTHCIHTAQALDDLDSVDRTIAILQRDNESLRCQLTRALSERIDAEIETIQDLCLAMIAALGELEHHGDARDGIRILREALTGKKRPGAT